MTEERLARKLQYLAMEGQELFHITVRHLSSYSMQALKAAGLTSAELDWVIPQQANVNIVERISQRLGFARRKFIENLADHGNTSSASIPIALDESVREGKIKKGDLVLFTAFGGGLTWGAALVRW